MANTVQIHTYDFVPQVQVREYPVGNDGKFAVLEVRTADITAQLFFTDLPQVAALHDAIGVALRKAAGLESAA